MIKKLFPAVLTWLLIPINLIFAGGSLYSPKYSNPFNEQWRWQNFYELTNKGCRCMMEDKNHSLWFGIDGGVLNYDGMNWNSFSLPKNMAGVPVVSLCQVSDGSLYVGTAKGIYRLKNSKWENISLNLDLGDQLEHPYNKIPIIESADKSVWIGTHQGIIRIKDNKKILYRDNGYYADPNKFAELRKQPLFDVYSLFWDKNGKLWVGLLDGRIFQCQFSSDNIYTNPSWKRIDTEAGYTKTKYPLVKVTSSGSVFIVSGQNDGGVNIKEGQRWKLFKSKNTFGIDDLYSDAIELRDGSMCIGGVGRIFIYKDGSWSIYESNNLPFASNRLILFETNNQNLFIIGLGNEVCRIDLSYQKWATLRELNFQTEDKSGNKWFIALDGSIVMSDSKMQKWERYTKADGVIDVPDVLFVSRNGNIWVAGSDNQTAATACFDGKKWTKQLHPKLGWGIERRAVFEAMDGSLWFGSASDILTEKGQVGGLVRYLNADNPDNLKFEYYYANDNFRLTAIYGIGQTADGSIWVGQLGFYCLKPGASSWQRILDPPGLNASFIDCIQSTPSGDLWVGTRTNGVYHLDGKTGKWSRYTINDGLSSNTIVNILVKSNTDVWVATNRDISHFDGKNWTKNSFHSFLKPKMDGISIRASKDGGLWVNQNLPAWYRKALYKDSFLGNSSNEFITTRYYPDKFAPKTIITFSQDKIAQPGNVILSWTAKVPWKLTPVEQIQYSYRIDDQEWSPFTYKTSNIFLSLPSGNHTFEVKARDRDMNIDPSPAEIAFYVEHPTWAQPWFILLILTFLSIIAFFIMHLYRRNKIIAEMSETKVRLFANISHELRTPLTLIMGPLLKVLESPLLDRELKKSLETVNKNCHRLLRLINQVLDFRKLEAGQMKFEPKHGDIIEFLKEEVEAFVETAASKDIYLKLDTDLEKLDIWFDPDKIEKVVFNLLSNALKFTPRKGSVTVHVSRIEASKVRMPDLGLKRPVKFSNWLEIIINDSGIGISQRHLDKVFDQFYQVKDNLKAAVGGTGIGLSVAREMIKIQGGKISVESSEGVGTSFIIKLPVIEDEIFEQPDEYQLVNNKDYIKTKYAENVEPEINEESGEEDDEQPKSNRSRILIVEDNAEMRQYIKEELEKEYDVMESVDGEDGLNKALNFNPDLILSDIMMPRMDGIEFCKRLKSDERTSHIAVILLTARASQEYKMEGLETGADDYLIKPFYNAELMIKIHNILETRRKLREKFGKTLQFEPNSIEITSVDQKFLKRAISIIEEHMDDADFSVETFSRLVGMSRVSLYNKLNSLTNHSVQKFIFAIRLKRAAQLLRESGMTVTEVAYSVGFKDPSHFSKLFKKEFGVSPKTYITGKEETAE